MENILIDCYFKGDQKDWETYKHRSDLVLDSKDKKFKKYVYNNGGSPVQFTLKSILMNEQTRPDTAKCKFSSSDQYDLMHDRILKDHFVNTLSQRLYDRLQCGEKKPFEIWNALLATFEAKSKEVTTNMLLIKSQQFFDCNGREYDTVRDLIDGLARKRKDVNDTLVAYMRLIESHGEHEIINEQQLILQIFRILRPAFRKDERVQLYPEDLKNLKYFRNKMTRLKMMDEVLFDDQRSSVKSNQSTESRSISPDSSPQSRKRPRESIKDDLSLQQNTKRDKARSRSSSRQPSKTSHRSRSRTRDPSSQPNKRSRRSRSRSRSSSRLPYQQSRQSIGAHGEDRQADLRHLLSTPSKRKVILNETSRRSRSRSRSSSRLPYQQSRESIVTHEEDRQADLRHLLSTSSKGKVLLDSMTTSCGKTSDTNEVASHRPSSLSRKDDNRNSRPSDSSGPSRLKSKHRCKFCGMSGHFQYKHDPRGTKYTQVQVICRNQIDKIGRLSAADRRCTACPKLKHNYFGYTAPCTSYPNATAWVNCRNAIPKYIAECLAQKNRRNYDAFDEPLQNTRSTSTQFKKSSPRTVRGNMESSTTEHVPIPTKVLSLETKSSTGIMAACNPLSDDASNGSSLGRIASERKDSPRETIEGSEYERNNSSESAEKHTPVIEPVITHEVEFDDETRLQFLI